MSHPPAAAITVPSMPLMSLSASFLLEDPVAAAPADVDPLGPALVDTVGVDPAFKVAVPVTDDEARVLGGKAVLACDDVAAYRPAENVKDFGWHWFPSIPTVSPAQQKA